MTSSKQDQEQVTPLGLLEKNRFCKNRDAPLLLNGSGQNFICLVLIVHAVGMASVGFIARKNSSGAGRKEDGYEP
jgi:hypothetical protein